MRFLSKGPVLLDHFSPGSQAWCHTLVRSEFEEDKSSRQMQESYFVNLKRSHDWKSQWAMCFSINANILGYYSFPEVYLTTNKQRVWLLLPECGT